MWLKGQYDGKDVLVNLNNDHFIQILPWKEETSTSFQVMIYKLCAFLCDFKTKEACYQRGERIDKYIVVLDTGAKQEMEKAFDELAKRMNAEL